MASDVHLEQASGSRMSSLDDEAAQLVLTSPPYFPPEVEPALREGVDGGADLDALRIGIQSFAWSLRPVFEECFRVLMPGGRMIVQTRDVRLRHILVPVESSHRQMIESLGMTLYTRHLWRPRHTTIARRRAAAAMAAGLGPAPFDPEVFLVFVKPGAVRRGNPFDEDIRLLGQDITCTAPGKVPQAHRFQSPLPLVAALVRTHSQEGDLVVDPFSGGGTVLLAARQSGRRAWGCDIDPAALELARRNLGLERGAHT